MKKLLVLFSGLLILASCTQEEGYKIVINMDSLGGTELKLQQRVAGDFVVIDSVVLDSLGQGVMSGKVSTEEMMYIGIPGSRRGIPVFMGNYKYAIDGTPEDPMVEAKKGPQVAYNEYSVPKKELENQRSEIMKKYRDGSDQGLSEEEMKPILDEYEAIYAKIDKLDSVYIAEHPSSIVSVYLLRNSFYNYNDEQLADKLDALDESLHSSTYYVFLADHLEKMKSVKIGNKYVDFELPDPDGNMVRLSDLAENGVLLIDFWASWCGPCRRANPGVVELYNEFHNKGFDILGVSLDRTREDWLEAIATDGLVWHHVSDLKFWGCEAAGLYAVSAIPHTVLLDQNGVIVARNLEKDELRAKLLELLGE